MAIIGRKTTPRTNPPLHNQHMGRNLAAQTIENMEIETTHIIRHGGWSDIARAHAMNNQYLRPLPSANQAMLDEYMNRHYV